MVPSVMVRLHKFNSKRNSYRQHTTAQVLMLQDQMVSKVSLDHVFVFGIRPPELLFIDKMEWYFRLFERSNSKIYNKGNGTLESILKVQLIALPFVDGLGHKL